MNQKISFPKTQTGVDGLDEITEGGFPKGRPTLICGSAGCGITHSIRSTGKTLMII